MLLAVVIDRLTRAAATRREPSDDTGRRAIPILWQLAGLGLVLAASIALKSYADLIAVASAVFFRLGELR